MTQPDYHKIAREFMDLWQKQLSAVVRDKQFVHAMLEMMQSMQAGNGKPFQQAADAPDAPDADARVLSELAFRVAMCERRLAALESGGKQKPAKSARAGKTEKSPAGGRTVCIQQAARLLDYGQKVKDAGTVVLFVPSLINRYYILDLSHERSMMRHLATQGLYPLVLDWDVPGDYEKAFDCGDYVTEILIPAIEFLQQTSGQKIVLAGYCMGGVMALAAAQLAKSKVAALALLATPWDFHCERFAPFVVNKQWRPLLDGWLKSQDTLPADIIQALFYWTDPFLFEHKFARFAGLPHESETAQEFVALEHWVNDGVPMTAGAARESLLGWAQENIVARGQWKVAGKIIDPATLKKLPAFIAMPQNDHVVPRDCAAPLAGLLPHATVVTPSSGHVGMIVGSNAKKEMWGPFAKWVSSVAG